MANGSDTRDLAPDKPLVVAETAWIAELVIWFFTVDFDSLWEGLLGRDPVARIWRDTGLWDETLAPRPALTTWQAWLDRARR